MMDYSNIRPILPSERQLLTFFLILGRRQETLGLDLLRME